MITEKLEEIYNILLKAFGQQHWWPGDSTIEIITGAILTQNTNWGNVEKAIQNLKSADVLNAEKLFEIEQDHLAQLIRPAGYFNIKAKRLKNFFQWLFERYDGQIESMENIPTYQLREELLAIKGIGPETADSILLYALGRPTFVIDAYTARIICRHQLAEPPIEYEQLQDLFQSNLTEDVAYFNEFHALLVRLGKDYCKPKPKCEICPLNHLPHTIEFEIYQ